jgi:hypothetical protein
METIDKSLADIEFLSEPWHEALEGFKGYLRPLVRSEIPIIHTKGSQVAITFSQKNTFITMGFREPIVYIGMQKIIVNGTKEECRSDLRKRLVGLIEGFKRYSEKPEEDTMMTYYDYVVSPGLNNTYGFDGSMGLACRLNGPGFICV